MDELGGLQEALNKASELAQVDEFGLIQFPEQKGFLDLLLEEMAKTSVSTNIEVNVLPEIPVADDLAKQLFILHAIQRDGGLAAYLPGYF